MFRLTEDEAQFIGAALLALGGLIALIFFVYALAALCSPS